MEKDNSNVNNNIDENYFNTENSFSENLQIPAEQIQLVDHLNKKTSRNSSGENINNISKQPKIISEKDTIKEVLLPVLNGGSTNHTETTTKDKIINLQGVVVNYRQINRV